MILATNQGSNFSSQGSAVAVSGDMLFTNCHVVLDDKNNPKWKQIAENGRIHALKNFNNDLGIDSLVDLMADLIK